MHFQKSRELMDMNNNVFIVGGRQRGDKYDAKKKIKI